MSIIVVAPFSMHNGLMSFYRKDNHFADVKFITKEEIINDFYGKVNEEGVAYLIKKDGYKASSAKEISKYIPFICHSSDSNKLNKLFSYNQEFKEKEYLKINEYLAQFFKGKEVLVYGYDKEDIELNSVFSALNVFPKYQNGEKNIDLKYHYVTLFNKTDIEVLNLLNEIASLIDNGIDINKIYIYTSDNIVLFYLKEFGKYFNIPINMISEEPLANLDLAKKFIGIYENNLNLDEALEFLNEQDDPLKENILKVVNDNKFGFLSNREQFELINESLKEWSIKSTHYDNAVRVIKNPIYAENTYIFVPCFAQGIVPLTKKDSDYLNNYEKSLFGIMDSELFNKIETNKIVEFLSSNNTFYLSFSKENAINKMSISPLCSLYGIGKKDFEMPTTFYSKTFAYMLASISNSEYVTYGKTSVELSSLKDLVEENPEYDNQYSGVDVFDENTAFTFSYSKINRFFSCPFSYYLEYILDINENKETFNIKLGNIGHEVFEKSYLGKKNFDEVFEQVTENQNLNILEKFLIVSLKDQVKEALDSYMLHETKYMGKHTIFPEKSITVELQQGLMFTGKIDKLNIINDKYAVVIDYKSGKQSFNKNKLQYGLNMQLPIYALLLNKSIDYKDYEIGGVYIANFINTEYSNVEQDGLIPAHLKLHGLTYADNNNDFLNSFDYSFKEYGNSYFIDKVGLGKSGFKSKQVIFSKDELNGYLKTVEDKIVEAFELIKANSFEIKPYKDGQQTACKYCSYKDICYVKEDQFNDLKSEIESDVADEN